MACGSSIGAKHAVFINLSATSTFLSVFRLENLVVTKPLGDSHSCTYAVRKDFILS
ncbi:hypothetical protein GCM10009001_05500 [Virgibacillus siamensis]|uniref:Uncharacterized protein n=1 Tax=Virgibacillus siamensis TaxID=480071 RepID=A0ABP3QQJ2_9BACI